MDRKITVVVLASLVEIVIALTFPLWVLTGTTGLVFALVVFLYHDEIKRFWETLTRWGGGAGIKEDWKAVLRKEDGTIEKYRGENDDK